MILLGKKRFFLFILFFVGMALGTLDQRTSGYIILFGDGDPFLFF